MTKDQEPELQIVEIDPDKIKQERSEIAIRYQILNERLDAIIQRIKQRKSESSN
jgi:hypothetical protein